MTEQWRKVPGYSRYSASSDGRVRRDVSMSTKPPGLLKIWHHKETGYGKVTMTSDDGKSSSLSLHVVVAAAFLGPRPSGMVTRHRDGNGANNAAANLCYGTHAENVRDAIEHGTQVRGNRQHLARLDEEAVAALKRQFIAGATMPNLAARFGVTKSTVFDIAKGRTWMHVEPSGDLRRLRPTQPRHGFRGAPKTSRFKGVSWDSKRAKWVASGRAAGRRTHLGYFDDEEAAANAVQRDGLAEPTDTTRSTASGRKERVWKPL